MKNLSYILAVGVMLILASCGQSDSGSELDELVAEYEDLKRERLQLDIQIKELEEKITAQDPERLKEIRKIAVIHVKRGEFTQVVPFQGTTISENLVNLSPETPGRITSVKVKEGQTVKAGQVIATIDVSALRKTLAEIENQKNLAETVYQKRERLWKQGIGSEIEYLNAKTTYEGLVKNYETVQSQVAKGTLRSPISGTVETVSMKSGEMGAPGFPIAMVVNNNDIRVKAEVSELYSDLIHKGDPVIVKFQHLNEELEAKITRVGQVINPANRTFSIEAKLKSVKGIKPNMVATIEVVEYRNPEVVSIPTKYISHSPKGDFVYIVQDKTEPAPADSMAVNDSIPAPETSDDKYKYVKRVMIKTGKSSGGWTEVIEGLEGSEWLVTDGAKDVIEGEKVNIVKVD